MYLSRTLLPSLGFTGEIPAKHVGAGVLTIISRIHSRKVILLSALIPRRTAPSVLLVPLGTAGTHFTLRPPSMPESCVVSIVTGSQLPHSCLSCPVRALFPMRP